MFRKSLAALGLALVASSTHAAGPLQCIPPDTSGPGRSAWVHWMIAGAPFDQIDWTMTIQKLPNLSSGYYWAYQGGFQSSSDGFYMGLQTYGCWPNLNDCTSHPPLAVFSYFGSSATNYDHTKCYTGADAGSGISCRIRPAQQWTVGRAYTLTVLRTVNGNSETFTGQVIDTVTHQASTIGWWTIPASRGGMSMGAGSFAEYYPANGSNPPACNVQPYEQALFSAPIGYAGKTAHQGQYVNCQHQRDCQPYIYFDNATSGRITVSSGTVGIPLPKGSYQQSCEYCDVQPSYVNCQCRESDGVETASLLGLPCAGIDSCDGELVCGGCPALPPGSYQASCSGCAAGPTRLTCSKCRTSSGSYVSSTIALPCKSNGITNCNGKLSCGGC